MRLCTALAVLLSSSLLTGCDSKCDKGDKCGGDSLGVSVTLQKWGADVQAKCGPDTQEQTKEGTEGDLFPEEGVTVASTINCAQGNADGTLSASIDGSTLTVTASGSASTKAYTGNSPTSLGASTAFLGTVCLEAKGAKAFKATLGCSGEGVTEGATLPMYDMTSATFSAKSWYGCQYDATSGEWKFTETEKELPAEDGKACLELPNVRLMLARAPAAGAKSVQFDMEATMTFEAVY